MVDQLLQGGDRSLKQLKAVAAIAPEEIPNIGRTYLQGVIEDARLSGWRDASFTKWKTLGKETKAMLFPKEQIKEIDQFFDLAKRIGANANPSGTTPTLIGIGASGLFIGPALMRGDWEGVKEGVQNTAGLMLSRSILSRLLYSPHGARLLRTGLTVKAAEPAAKNVARLLTLELQRASKEPTENQ